MRACYLLSSQRAGHGTVPLCNAGPVARCLGGGVAGAANGAAWAVWENNAPRDAGSVAMWLGGGALAVAGVP